MAKDFYLKNKDLRRSLITGFSVSGVFMFIDALPIFLLAEKEEAFFFFLPFFFQLPGLLVVQLIVVTPLSLLSILSPDWATNTTWIPIVILTFLVNIVIYGLLISFFVWIFRKRFKSKV